MTGMVRAVDFLWKRRLAVPTGIIRSKGIPVTEPNWLTGYGPNMSTNWAHSVGTTGVGAPSSQGHFKSLSSRSQPYKMVQLTISSSKPVGGRSLNFTVDVAADATIRNVKSAIASKYPKVCEFLGWLWWKHIYESPIVVCVRGSSLLCVSLPLIVIPCSPTHHPQRRKEAFGRRNQAKRRLRRTVQGWSRIASQGPRSPN